MTREELDLVKSKLKKYREDSEIVESLGGFSTKTVQSDKLGFDWIERYLGDALVSRTYVEQEHPVGTADSPIEWKPGMSLIQNAYYTHNDARKVWMGETGFVADNFYEEEFVEF